MSGAQLLYNTWVCYSHNIPPMIKMSNQNITQRGTQARSLCVMIGRYSPESQHGRSVGHPANVGCSFFRDTNDDLRNHTKMQAQNGRGKTINFHCTAILRSNPTLRGYKKRMIKIWQECASLQTTSQRIAKRFVFWPWNTKIYKKTNNEQYTNTISAIPSIDKPEKWINCQIFLDEAWWFLSSRVFELLSSSLLLFPQRFGWYVLRPSSGVCWTREPTWNSELRSLLNPWGSLVLIFIVKPCGTSLRTRHLYKNTDKTGNSKTMKKKFYQQVGGTYSKQH